MFKQDNVLNEFTVEQANELLQFLYDMMPNRGRNSVKNMLSRGQILVNHRSTTQFNFPLRQGDRVTLLRHVILEEDKPAGLSILYEDQDIIVIDKEAGLLSIAAGNEMQPTAHQQLMDYVRKSNSRNRVFIVHRLDRDTSGVMVFAKHEKAKTTLQHNWQQYALERTYVGLVEKQVKKQSDSIKTWLKESKTLMMYSSSYDNGGQLAITHYNLLQATRDYSLLDIRLETGRKNQIRVHMQHIGHPICGDKKYGSSVDPLKRLALHAHILTIVHPTKNKPMRFESPVPRAFYRFFR